MAKGSISNMVDLQKKAEEIYPLPFKKCPFIIKKTMWLRERWVIDQMNGDSPST